MAVSTERLPSWPEAGLRRLALDASRVLHVPWVHVSTDLVRRHAPEAVLCPLVGPNFDAVDMADRLGAARYGGMLVVAVPAPLPNPRVIHQEINRAGGGKFQVEIIC